MTKSILNFLITILSQNWSQKLDNKSLEYEYVGRLQRKKLLYFGD